MQNTTPCLWFDSQAEEAANFYVSIFKNSKISTIARYGDAGAKLSGREPGSVMTVTFELDGQEYMALNGGPVFTFSPAISFVVHCDSQEEIDHMWDRLSEGGQTEQCGWLRDKYGVSWQIVPRALGAWMKNGTEAQQDRLMGAIGGMLKLDVKALEAAYRG